MSCENELFVDWAEIQGACYKNSLLEHSGKDSGACPINIGYSGQWARHNFFRLACSGAGTKNLGRK